MAARSKIEFLQVFRGIAALSVVLWHGSRYIAPYGTGWSGWLFEPGATMGVDLFFLISGFIMVETTRSSDGSFAYCADFMVKRIVRIWPPYFVATMAYILLVENDWHYLHYHGKLIQLVRGLLFLPNPAGQGILAPDYGFPPLPVGWTLNYEMYFYLFFAVSMAFGRLRWLALTAWIGATVLVLPTLIERLAYGRVWLASLSPDDNYDFTAGYLCLVTNPMILLFFCGAMIGLIYRTRFEIRDKFTVKVLVFLAASFAIWQYLSHTMIAHGVLQCGMSLIPLMLVFSLASKTIDLEMPPALVYLGDISFSLYIFHPVVQELFDRYMLHIGALSRNGMPAFLFTMALSLAVAAISHRVIEQGFCNWLRRRLMPARYALPLPA